MRAIKLRPRWTVLAVIVAIAVYLLGPSSEPPASQAVSSTSPSRATTPAPKVQLADATAMSHRATPSVAQPLPIVDEVRRLGYSARLAALPEPDQAWVLGRASEALAVGQVSREQLAQHIEELASIRQFAVLEREAPYTPAEEPNPSTEDM